MKYLLFIFALFLSSCESFKQKDVILKPNWFEKIEKKSQVLKEEEKEIDSIKKSYSFNNINFYEFTRILERDFKYSIIIDSDLDEETIRLDVHELTFTEILSILARRYNLEFTVVSDKHFHIKKKTSESRQDYIFDVIKTISPDELKVMLDAVITSNGKVSVSKSGEILVVDDADRLVVIRQLIKDLKNNTRSVYALQLYLFAISDNDLKKLDFSGFSNFNFTLSKDLDFEDTDIIFEGLLSFASDSTTSKVLATPYQIIRVGEKGEIKQVDQYNYRTVTPNENGTFETKVETIEYGFIANSMIFEQQKQLSLNCDLELSSIFDFNNDLPLIRKLSITSVSQIMENLPILIASFNYEESMNSQSILGFDNNLRNYNVKVFAKCMRLDDLEPTLKRPLQELDKKHPEQQPSIK